MLILLIISYIYNKKLFDLLLGITITGVFLPILITSLFLLFVFISLF